VADAQMISGGTDSTGPHQSQKNFYIIPIYFFVLFMIILKSIMNIVYQI